MSRYREYAIWKNRTGYWTVATYVEYPTGDPTSPDWDCEWDNEYDYNAFSWVSEGHITEDAARRQLTPNPGHGGDVATWEEEGEQVEGFELMLKMFKDPKFAEQYRKEEAEKKAETVQAELANELKKRNGYLGGRLSVTYGNSAEAVGSGLGMFSTVTAVVKKGDDGWYVVDGRNFFNPETGKLDKLVASYRTVLPYSYY